MSLRVGMSEQRELRLIVSVAWPLHCYLPVAEMDKYSMTSIFAMDSLGTLNTTPTPVPAAT